MNEKPGEDMIAWYQNLKQGKAVNKYDRPDLAMLQNFEMTADPKLGYPPTERLLDAFEQAKTKFSDRHGLQTAIAGVNWTERGPDNVGGRTRALIFDPNDASSRKVWAGGVSGGLWYNNDITNPQSQWHNVDDFMANLAITTLAYDPTDHQTFYAGTGEGWFNFDAVRGAGIWKSTDGGATWTQLASTDNNVYSYVQKIVVTNQGTVLAAVRASNAPSSAGGIFRSTNGGTSWDQELQGRGADIEIADNGDVYASLGIFNDGELHKSTNDGDTWTEITTIPANGERMEIATAPSNSDVVYVVASNGNDIEWFSRSGDAGATWSDLTIPNSLQQSCDVATDDFARGQAWYNLILAVHPEDEDVLIAGGISLHRSADGGTNWGESDDGKPVSYWTGFCEPFVHADQHNIIFRPNFPNEAIIGNDGGVFLASGLDSFTPNFYARNKGYNVTQFYSVAAENQAGSNYYLGGTQDNGTHQFTDPGINSTTEVTGGDGAFCFIDQSDSQIQISSFIGNSYRLSTNGGSSFTNISDDQSTGRFINPAVYDSDEQILYAAGNADQYVRYFDLTTTPDDEQVSVSLGGEQISALATSPYTDNLIFVGTSEETNDGPIFKIENADGTPTVTDISGSLPDAGTVSSIQVGADDDQLLITFSNFGLTSVWETTDGGTTWNDKEGNLPDMPVRWALYNPGDLDEVLLATELGVWSTDDLSVSSPDWDPTSTDLANVRCDMLQYRDSDGMVVVATHGRGLFTSDVFVATANADFKVASSVAYLNAPVQFTDQSTGTGNSFSWDFGDGTNSGERNPSHNYTTAGTYSVSLSINSGADTETKTDLITVLPDRAVSYLAANGGNFESNQSDFAAYNASGTGFELGNSAVSGKDGTSSGSSAWITGLAAANYDNNSEAFLYTPNFDFTNAGTYSLEFSAKYSFEDTYDGFIVEYSLDRGDSWTRLEDLVSSDWYDVNAAIDNAVFAPGERFFSGNTSGAYDVKMADLTFLAGNQNVAFRFVFRSDPGTQDVGMAIDDVSVVGPTTPAFTVDKQVACISDDVVFTDASSGTITSYDWDFGADATPATATGAGPHTVSYGASGTKTVKLTINGSLFEEKIDFITVDPPDVTISQDVDNNLVASVTADSYQWFFEGTAISGATSQMHSPSLLGDYTVEITVGTCVGTSPAFSVVVVSLDRELEDNLSVFPNPAGDYIQIDATGIKVRWVDISLNDAQGKRLFNERVELNSPVLKHEINTSALPRGVYLLELGLGDSRVVRRVIRN